MDEKKRIENLISALNYCKNLNPGVVDCTNCPYSKGDLYNNIGECRSELIKDAGQLLYKYLDLGTPDYIEYALTTYSSLLTEITHNKLSKTGYTLETILDVIKETTYTQDDIDEALNNLDKNSFVRIKDVLDCFEGIDMRKDVNYHAVMLIEWAFSKRALSKSEVRRLLDTSDEDTMMPAT